MSDIVDGLAVSYYYSNSHYATFYFIGSPGSYCQVSFTCPLHKAHMHGQLRFSYKLVHVVIKRRRPFNYKNPLL